MGDVRRRRAPSTLAVPAIGAAAVAVMLVAVAVRLSSANDPAGATVETAPEATVGSAVAPSPVEPPTPELTPVAGERIPAAHWVDATGILTHDRPAPGDPDVVLPLAHAVGDWLDAHLDDLQRGGPGRLEDVASPALLAAATPVELVLVTSALASPAAPVGHATYRLDVSYAAAAEWLTATVTVSSVSGDTATATLVFVPDDAGQPELVLLGAEEAA